ncbi:MAG: sulfide:quinone oxidoreductase, partial [Candidatus Marinamargulisbacteria bacterium]
EHEVVVVANSHWFRFVPSFPLIPFGLREESDVSFDVRPIFRKNGISFIENTVIGLEPKGQFVYTRADRISYDYLLIATGPSFNMSEIPGLSSQPHSHAIFSFEQAVLARKAWTRFIANPGPIVVGISPRAFADSVSYEVAYKFVFLMYHELEKLNLLDRAPITFLTPEPYLSHIASGGIRDLRSRYQDLFDHYHIQWKTQCTIRQLTATEVVVKNDVKYPSKFTVIMPGYGGIPAFKNVQGLTSPQGLIRVDETLCHPEYRTIFAAGMAVDIPPSELGVIPQHVSKTFYPSELMGKTAALNIIASIKKEPLKYLPFDSIRDLCVRGMEAYDPLRLQPHVPLNTHKLVMELEHDYLEKKRLS